MKNRGAGVSRHSSKCTTASLWLSLSLILLVGSTVRADPAMREAPNASAVPANQLLVAGNACGPTSLLNAFRFGSDDWQQVANSISGKNDRERIFTIIREIGMRPSKHLTERARWSRRGVGLADLTDMANEMSLGHNLPYVHDEVFLIKPRESPEKLLRRVHQRLEKSLKKGFPPIISLRRLALRKPTGDLAQWVVIDAHFVTLIAVPQKLENNARAFPVRYIDPWGGRLHSGQIAISEKPVLSTPDGQASCLEASFPNAIVGKKKLRSGETSVLTIAAGIGRW